MLSDDNLMSWIMKPHGSYVFIIYILICIHDHDYVMDFYLMVMLRSTTGPYGRPELEAAYGESYFTPPRLFGRC